MDHFVEPRTEVNGNPEAHRSPKGFHLSGAYQRSSTKDMDLSEQKTTTRNGHCYTALPNGNGSFDARNNVINGNRDTRRKQTRNETVKSKETNSQLNEETEVNSYPNTEMANSMADTTICQSRGLALDNKKENQNETPETELKLKSERKEPAMILQNDDTLTSERENRHKCSTERETKSEVESRRNTTALKDETPMKMKQDNSITITGKLENYLHEKEDLIRSLKKRVHELEMEIECITEQCEEEKRKIQQKYDEAFLKLVDDNRRMNESLLDIQVHVRREKIESERTKNEVEKALRERQKLVDQVQELTKCFESMNGEKERMEIIIETTISAFDAKLSVKEDEIRNLQETIDNDRKQFMEERDQYLTVIESLKTQLLLQEDNMIYSKAI